MPLTVRCARCLNRTDDVELRQLFGIDILRIVLCGDCNDLVQGPAHIDIETGNKA